MQSSLDWRHSRGPRCPTVDSTRASLDHVGPDAGVHGSGRSYSIRTRRLSIARDGGGERAFISYLTLTNERNLLMASITDTPITSIAQDLLQIKTYSDALSEFIAESDTPITIGLQGEWGTGKTSLMAILLENLSCQNIATSWVNTWEHSLFRTSKEVTPKVLKSMLEQLEISCRERGVWENTDEIDKAIKKVGRILGNVANQMLTMQTGLDVLGAANLKSPQAEGDIAEIKKDITLIIQRLIASVHNPIEKVVFFVDDLDRIPPTEAVELLEALKNIFDIPNCVFVLAIDYDVVVKGLESKFGPKTEKNEREFRSFFDKIIQVPFSMPVGIYSMKTFLAKKLEDLGVSVDKDDAAKYAEIVRFTTGSNPRSLKRYLNSFSLTNKVRARQSDDDAASNDLMLFALLGIQVSFPQIFRLISQEPNYVQWDKSLAAKRNIDLDQVDQQLHVHKGNELVDEPWEKIVWATCQNDPYLKVRSFEILELMNLLRDEFGDDLSEQVEHALDYAAITSVDDDAEGKQSTRKIGNKTVFNSLEDKLEQLALNKVSVHAAALYRGLIEKFEVAQKQHSNLSITMAKTQTSIGNNDVRQGKNILYISNPGKREHALNFFLVNKFAGTVYPSLKERIRDAVDIDEENIASLVSLDKWGNVLIKAKLKTVSSEAYEEVLSLVVKHVIACCAKGLFRISWGYDIL